MYRWVFNCVFRVNTVDIQDTGAVRQTALTALVNEVVGWLRRGCGLVVNRVGRYVYLRAKCGDSLSPTFCEFANNPKLCIDLIESLVSGGVLSREYADELMKHAERHLSQAGQQAKQGVGPVVLPDVLRKVLEMPKGSQGALRELSELIDHIVAATSQLARRYHALGYLTERLILSRVGFSSGEAMKLWRLSDEEYLARMLKYIVDMADAYRHFNAKVKELREEYERLKEENNRLTVELAYLEEELERIKPLADEAAQLLDALKIAIASQAPIEVINTLLKAYISSAALGG